VDVLLISFIIRFLWVLRLISPDSQDKIRPADKGSRLVIFFKVGDGMDVPVKISQFDELFFQFSNLC
jgi:hypothetical protein